jgi:hypothetical protein
MAVLIAVTSQQVVVVVLVNQAEAVPQQTTAQAVLDLVLA